MISMKNILPLILLLSVLTMHAADQSTPPPASAKDPKPSHFLIVLRPVPRLHDAKAWTDADNAAVMAHFNRLKAATETGQVLLAGRTTEPLAQSFGLVVFQAADEPAAREFMQADPCIAAGVMTGELHPYGVALRAK